MAGEILNFSDRAFALFAIGMFLILLVVLIWQGTKTARAMLASRVQIARDEAYRKLAEEAIVIQKQLAEDIADLRARTASIEKLLRDIE